MREIVLRPGETITLGDTAVRAVAPDSAGATATPEPIRISNLIRGCSVSRQPLTASGASSQVACGQTEAP